MTRHAPNDLLANGSYGKNVAGLIIHMRASKVPFDSIPEIILNTLGICISKSTAINAVYRIQMYWNHLHKRSYAAFKSDHMHPMKPHIVSMAY